MSRIRSKPTRLSAPEVSGSITRNSSALARAATSVERIASREHAAQGPQHIVGHRAPVARADGAEAVDFDHGERECAAVTARALYLFVQAALERRQREQAGERLAHRAQLDLPLKGDDPLSRGG